MAALSLLQTTLVLDRGEGCIAAARHLAAGFLTRARTQHGLAVSSRSLEVTQLLVSELVTNSYKYAPGPITLTLNIPDPALVEVAVWDSDPVLPVARAADPGRIGQHGLEVVMAIADRLDIEAAPGGKRITAAIPLTDV